MRKQLLERLLTKYEKSKHAAGQAQVQRRITLTLGKKEFRQYYQGDHLDFRKSLHLAATELEREGLIQIEWVPFEKGNLIKALHLVLDRLDDAYMVVGRKSSDYY
ncbi:MAG: hypothetical protein M0021_11895 [Clostridia bacterium]|nr:hypothetical protein [Clostridia bacterium]